MVQDRRPAHWPTLLGALALMYLVAVVFLPILGFEFVDFDVSTSVVHNPHIRGLTGENLRHILTSRCIESYYPVRTLTYAVDYSIWGLNPLGFKLTNGLIHLANVMLAFWLILRLFWGPAAPEGKRRVWWDVPAAAFSAGILAVHPVVVEPVAWVAGREELLMTLGALGCLHFHVTARGLSQEGGKIAWAVACHVAAAVCCAAACLSNAVAAVIPLLIVAWDVLTLNRPKWWKILYGTAALWAIGILTVVAKGSGQDPAVAGEIGVFSTRRLMLVLNAYWLNLKTLVWPKDLALSYGMLRPESFLAREVILGGVALCLTGVALWKLRRQKSVLFGLLWFGVALGPTAQILPHHVHRADRFLYLPLVGLAVALACGIRPLGRVLRSRLAVLGAAALGVVALWVLGVRSSNQVETWRDAVTVWQNCAEVSPDSAFVHDLLARNLARRGQSQRADEHARRSLELDLLDNPKALCNRAMGLALFPDSDVPDREEAVRLAQRACELTEWKDPECRRTLATAYCALANGQAADQQFAPAVENYYQAMEADDQYNVALFNLAILRTTCSERTLRSPEEAVRLAERGCKLLGEPTPDRLRILAKAYVAAGRLDMAVATAEKAARIAQSAGDARTVDEIRRWIQEQQDRWGARSNVVDGESEAALAPDPSAGRPGNE